MSNFLITKRYLEDFQLSTIFCRLAVIVTFVLSSAGGTAWGQTEVSLNIITHQADCSSILSSEFDAYDDSNVLILTYYNNKGQDISNWGIGGYDHYGNWNASHGLNAPASVPDGSDFEISLTVGDFKSAAKNGTDSYVVGYMNGVSGTGVTLRVYNCQLKSAKIIVPITDPFLGKAKSSVTPGNGSQEVEKTETSGSFTLAGVYGNSIKYARIVLCDETGKALDDQSKLVVTYDGTAAVAAGSKTKNGVYIYNNGAELDKSKISITLNAGLNNMTKYRIKCLLAEDAATVDGGNVTKEPDWDYEYTYRFTYPARGQFPALNISTVKTKYKTVQYDESSRQTTPRLLSNWYEVAGDCDASRTVLAENGYIRWYLENAETGDLIAMSSLTNGGYTQASDAQYGYYRYQFDAGNFRKGNAVTGNGDYDGYNPTITLPEGADYTKVRVVAVVTTLLDEMDLPTQEPEAMQVKYVYTLKTQTELQNAPFVHYQGESHRDYKIVDDTPGADQSSYQYDSGVVDATTYQSQNIRQDVHQTDYYVYLNLADGESVLLNLPIEDYHSLKSEGRTGTEPLGYFRWYDWNTDLESACLTPEGTGTLLKSFGNRGLVATMIPMGDGYKTEPFKNHIGARFVAPTGFNSNTNEIVLACDISRYMDGMDDSKTYLVHEPTLSMRYLFHILPASVIADDIDAAATLLKSVEDGTKTYSTLGKSDYSNLFKTYEDNGRVVVSLNGTTGKFSLRANLQGLDQYFINNGSSQTQCSQLQWYCYYENDGKLYKKQVEMGERGTKRLAKYEATDFKGTYTEVGGTDTYDLTIANDTQLHLVGYLGNGSVEKAVIHYELDFLSEAPALLGSEPEHRQNEYMHDNLTHGNTLDFNDTFDAATRFDTPTSSAGNYVDEPMAFTDAQYGFCYPQLYGQDASSWMIHHGGWWEGYGISPTHSDYTLLKTMNLAEVSGARLDNGSNDDALLNSQSYFAYWYEPNQTVLYDVTHERLYQKNPGAKNGSYLYIDAADEARTIASLSFKASLCANSQIYYTAYIANMTPTAKTPPQVLFRVSTDVEEKVGGVKVTKRVPVVSFLTGDILTEGATETGQWYQVYGQTLIPGDQTFIDGSERTYYVTIDNYCEDTDGADYAVDQISFFTTSAKVNVQQTSTPCDENSAVQVRIFTQADDFIEVVGKNKTKTLFYRIFEKSSDPDHVLNVSDAVAGPYKNESKPTDANIYGSAVFTANYGNVDDLPVDYPSGGTTGFYKTSDGTVYFQFDDRTFNLETGKSYFVSFYSLSATEVKGFDGWGAPYSNSICSDIFSNDITPKSLIIEMESGGETSDGTISLSCNETSITKDFNITVQYPTADGYSPHSDVMFDFYLGSKDEFKGIMVDELFLETAIDHLRSKSAYQNVKYETAASLPTDYDADYTEAMHDIIATYINNGKLRMYATRVFSYTFTSAEAGELDFTAIPVSLHTTDGDICSPLEFVFNVDDNSNAPKMVLGFDDVDYPEEYTKRVVRVGLEQLSMMKNEGYKLHIPVSSFENKGSGRDRKLLFNNPILTVSATNDPTATVGTIFAKIYDPNGGSNATDVYVDMSRMYLPLDLSICNVDFHEGYYYEVSSSFYDAEEATVDESMRCIGDIYLVIKVVPEFATWNAREIDTDLFSGNWYDDGNWNRSTRAELYKGEGQNTPGHTGGSSYQDNTEINTTVLTDDWTSHPGFVPMKFTYVTMLGNNHSPSLINEDYGGKIGGTTQQGGALINPEKNEMGTDTSPSGGSCNPTENIRYDMLVRYGTHAEGGVGCFGHRYMLKTDDTYYFVEGSTTGLEEKAFDVEKFYGNICKEIYFKPGAELRLQQRLTYERAWVEKELEPNKWYLMSTPLKATYAGDMYVPAIAMTDYSLSESKSVTGRQVTEAFQPITFADKNASSQNLYSRTKYPFYQRSWGKAEWGTMSEDSQAAKVYTKTDDIRQPSFAPYIDFTSISSTVAEWGHVYNDVTVPYNNFSGFSIRANRKTMTDNALIRLPKADTEYSYYQWDDQVPGTGAVAAQTVTKETGDVGRFVFDNTLSDHDQWEIPLASLQAQGTDSEGYTYYLVGNPFMASIDMGKFFGYLDDGVYYSYNPKLAKVYYTYEASTLTAVDAKTTAGIIRPLQAFFVKCKKYDAPDNIVFSRWAITDGNYTPPTTYADEPNQATGNVRRYDAQVSLKAMNGKASSVATVRLGEGASDNYLGDEDVLTLFDSNLNDVPTVFTMAGQQAVSIDSRQSIGIVPFCVSCAVSDQMVEVAVSEKAIIGQLFVVDAVTGETTEVSEGCTFMVQPNDYGRYFLTSNGDLTSINKAEANKGIVVSVRGHEVTVRANEPLKVVRSLTLDGETVSTVNTDANEAVMTLNDGVYIIEAQTASTKKTMKIIVK